MSKLNINKAAKQAEKNHAIDHLQALLKDNPTIYGICKKVSASGMRRTLQLFIIKDNQPLNISGNVSRALDTRLDDNGVVVDGAGMCMLFATVYRLNNVLFPEQTNTDVNYQWFE